MKTNTVKKQKAPKAELTKKVEYEPDRAIEQVFQTKAESISNLIDELYFGTAEKTFQESSVYADSMYKPYNPDDLFQKTNDYSIYEDMLQDEQVSICMQIKKDMVVGSGWDIITEVDNPLHAEIKEKLHVYLSEDPVVPFDDQIAEIISAYEYGFSISEKLFKHRPDGSLSWNQLKTRHPSTWLIYTNQFGNIEKFQQRGVTSSVDIEPKRVLHLVNNSRFQNPYGTSDLRSAYNAWFIKRQIIRFYGIFLEKAASPIPIAKYDKNVSQAAVTDIYNAIRKFQTKTALTIPKEIEVEFLESKSNGDVFIRGINIFNMFIGRSLNIPDLLGFQGSETSGGSYSLGKDQMEILLRHIERRRVSVERLINREIIWPIVAYNWGFVEKYPKFKFRPVSDTHLIELAKLWTNVVTSRVYKPSPEEINHFRRLARFPEGTVEGIKEQQEDIIDDEIEKAEGQADAQAGAKPEVKSEQKMSYKIVYDVPKGDFHKKVDFKSIGKEMDSAKEKIISEAEPIIKRIYVDLADQIEKKKILKNQNAEKIEDLKVKYLKDVKLLLKTHLRQVYQDGKARGQKELLKGTFRTPLPDDAFLEFLEAETFQFVGDWSYNIHKNAAVVLRKAIRDGLPLSAVLDEIDGEGPLKSIESIERFARTKTTDVMNRGRLASFNQSGVVAAYQYSAILDDRTSEICDGLNGKIFKAGDEPVPPLHFNCRSLLIPITKYEEFEPDETIGKRSIDDFIEEFKGEGFSKR